MSGDPGRIATVSRAGAGAAPHAATIVVRGEAIPCVVGAAGIRRFKSEGDHATPAGILPIRTLLYRADRVAIPPGSLPRAPIGPDDGWCDDPDHPDYNRMVTRPHPGRSEALWREDGCYDLVGVLGYNDRPVERGRGSAIFLHVAPNGGGPTKGCVGLALAPLRALLGAGIDALDIRAD